MAIGNKRRQMMDSRKESVVSLVFLDPIFSLISSSLIVLVARTHDERMHAMYQVMIVNRAEKQVQKKRFLWLMSAGCKEEDDCIP